MPHSMRAARGRQAALTAQCGARMDVTLGMSQSHVTIAAASFVLEEGVCVRIHHEHTCVLRVQ